MCDGVGATSQAASPRRLYRVSTTRSKAAEEARRRRPPRIPAEADAQRPRGQCRAHAHGRRAHGERVDLARRAGRARRHGEAGEIEGDQRVSARKARHGEAAWCSAAVRPISEHHGIRRASSTRSRARREGREAGAASAAQARRAAPRPRRSRRCRRRSRCRPRSRASCPPPRTNGGVEAASSRRGPGLRHPSGPPNLWRRQGQRIGAEGRHVERRSCRPPAPHRR